MNGQNRKRWIIAGAVALVFGLAAAAGWGWFNFLDRNKPLPTPAAADMDRLHTNCVEEMIRSTCKVMGNPQPLPGATSVFVAGVGPVDAAYYLELRASGDAMCAVVRQACQADWDGPRCRTARGLYGNVPAKPASGAPQP